MSTNMTINVTPEQMSALRALLAQIDAQSAQQEAHQSGQQSLHTPQSPSIIAPPQRPEVEQYRLEDGSFPDYLADGRRKKRINGEATLRYIYKLPKDTQQQQQSPSPLPSTIQSTPRVQHQSPQSGAYQSGPRATQSPGLISHNQTQILPQPGSQVHNSKYGEIAREAEESKARLATLRSDLRPTTNLPPQASPPQFEQLSEPPRHWTQSRAESNMPPPDFKSNMLGPDDLKRLVNRNRPAASASGPGPSSDGNNTKTM